MRVSKELDYKIKNKRSGLKRNNQNQRFRDLDLVHENT